MKSYQLSPNNLIHINQKDVALFPEKAEVLKELELILGSSVFTASKRLSDFLRFVTEKTLASESRSIKQYTIGVEVYGRKPTFDPKTDPLVRIEAGRLRRALNRYYEETGKRDPVLIQIPRGTYVPRFRWATVPNIDVQECSDRAKPAPKEAIQPPVVAVFPMENRGEEQHAYLVDGLAEELTFALSRYSCLRVLAYCTTSRFKDKQRDICDIASSLGANFALTGTLRKSGELIRINVNLLNVKNREQLWSKRFQEQLIPTHLFDFEDKIVHQVLGQVADNFGVIQRSLSHKAECRRISEPSAYEAVLRNLHFQLTLTPKTFHESFLALKHASKLEPNSAIIWAMLSLNYLDAAVFGYEEIPNALESGINCASRAVSLDPGCQYAQHAKAFASLIERNRPALVTAAERMVAINPNAAFMVGAAGFWLCIAGEYERGMDLFRKGIELNPLFPTWLHAGPYFYHMHKDEYIQALHHANEFGMPDFFWAPLMKASVLGLLGRTTDAKKPYNKLVELQPDFPTKAADYIGFFVLDGQLREKMLAGLKESGLVNVIAK